MGEAAALKAAMLCKELREEGFEAQTDIVGRGLKAQMRYANKLGARFTIVLGDSEIDSGKAKLKCMENGNETEVDINALTDALYEATFSALAEAFEI